MAVRDTTKSLRDLLDQVCGDLEKAEKGNKAASQRVRTGTIKLEKMAKAYRKESVQAEKGSSSRKPKGKKAMASRAAKPKTKKAPSRSAKPKRASKRATAKLPKKR